MSSAESQPKRLRTEGSNTAPTLGTPWRSLVHEMLNSLPVANWPIDWKLDVENAWSLQIQQALRAKSEQILHNLPLGNISLDAGLDIPDFVNERKQRMGTVISLDKVADLLRQRLGNEPSTLRMMLNQPSYFDYARGVGNGVISMCSGSGAVFCTLGMIVLERVRDALQLKEYQKQLKENTAKLAKTNISDEEKKAYLQNNINLKNVIKVTTNQFSSFFSKVGDTFVSIGSFVESYHPQAPTIAVLSGIVATGMLAYKHNSRNLQHKFAVELSRLGADEASRAMLVFKENAITNVQQLVLQRQIAQHDKSQSMAETSALTQLLSTTGLAKKDLVVHILSLVSDNQLTWESCKPVLNLILTMTKNDADLIDLKKIAGGDLFNDKSTAVENSRQMSGPVISEAKTEQVKGYVLGGNIATGPTGRVFKEHNVGVSMRVLRSSQDYEGTDKPVEPSTRCQGTFFSKIPPNPSQNASLAKALCIFREMLAQSLWKASHENLNEFQAFWLYKWMGPLCTIWVDNETTPQYRRPEEPTSALQVARFASEVCRARFAFLKSMLIHSALFLFMDRNEAIDYFTKPEQNPKSCISTALKSGPNGKGWIILHNCAPGYFTIIGKNMKGQQVLADLSADSVVNVEKVQQLGTEQQDWSFKHSLILHTVLQEANRQGITELIANECWKYVESPAKITNSRINAIPTLNPIKYLNIFPKGTIADSKDHQTMRKSIMKSDAIIMNQKKTLGYYPTYLYLSPNQPTADSDLDKISKKFDRVIQLANRAAENKGNFYPMKLNDIQINHMKNDADTKFIQCLREQLNFDSNIQDCMQNAVSSALEMKKWKDLFGQQFTYKEPFLVFNFYCINPMAVVYKVSDNEVCCVIGDAWFLETFIRCLQENTYWFQIKRFGYLQEEMDKCWQADGGKRQLVQDTLYTYYWRNLIGVNCQ